MPSAEFGKSASGGNERGARGKYQVIGVGKDALAAEFAHLGVRDSLDGCGGRGTNKGWGLNIAVRGVDCADTHKVGLFVDIKL